MYTKRVGLGITLVLLALTVTGVACRTFTIDFIGTRPEATVVLKQAGTPALLQENARLKTRVAELEATLQSSPTPQPTETQAAEQAPETTQAPQSLLHLQHFAPLIFAGATNSSDRLVSGSIVLEEGRCCAGGVVGQVIQIGVEFQASSPEADITEMRVRPGSQFYDEQEMQAAPWEPYRNQEQFPVPVVINWVGFYISVQYRDALGNLSPVYHDDISIEGQPATPTMTPTIEVPPSP
jgi:hypothetical protein